MTWLCCATAGWARCSPAPTPPPRWDRSCARSPSGTSANSTPSLPGSWSTWPSTPSCSAHRPTLVRCWSISTTPSWRRLSRVSWKLRWRPPARTDREVGVGRPPRHHRQGTAVTKKYQKQKIDTPSDGFVVPERVSVAMAEIAGSMREGLLALAGGTGLQVMRVLMEADVAALAGPKGRHDPGRTAVRHGHERGSVTLGGRRVPVTRPRVRAAAAQREAAVERIRGELVRIAAARSRLATTKPTTKAAARRRESELAGHTRAECAPRDHPA